MPILTDSHEVRARFEEAGRKNTPILCPNAETPDEMEGVLLAAEDFRCARGLERITVGVGITATYPDHPQLAFLSGHKNPNGDILEEAARTWLGWLGLVAAQKRFSQVEAVPFLDHGWAAHEADRHLMTATWFQDAMGLIMFDASSCDFAENVTLTGEYVASVNERVVVEGCPDKVYERAELEAKGLGEADLLSDPDQVESFLRKTGVFLVVPNLGTEHRSASDDPLEYQADLARELRKRVGSRLALHGTSSLGGRIGTVGRDGVCKINYYTAMAREASASVRSEWAQHPERLPIGQACGSFLFRTRREAVRQNLLTVLHTLAVD